MPARRPTGHRTNRAQARRRIAIAKANGEPCCRCGQPIDYDLQWDKHHPPPGYPTADHLHPVMLGGSELVSMEMLGPAHLACNSRHGSRLRAAVAGKGKAKRNRKGEIKGGTRFLGGESESPGPPHSVFFHSTSTEDPTNSRRIPDTLSKNAREPGERDGLPRYFSEPHPEAVRSRGDEMVAWAEARRGQPLRWWQWLCAQRRYEIRADGSWCWTLLFESAPRQQGKSVGLAEDAAWFAGEGAGDRVEVLHAAHTLKTSLLVQAELWAWAEVRGLEVRRLLGDSRIIWPDESVWATVAMDSAYGRRPHRLLVDEAWAMDPVKFWNSMFPALGDHDSVQVLFFSAANIGDKGLVADLRSDPEVCRMEWGALPGEDQASEATWRASSAYWGPGRLDLMRKARKRPGFAENWLNIWPETGTEAASGMVGADAWEALASQPVPWTAAAVEAAPGAMPVVALAGPAGDGTAVVSVLQARSMQEAARLCARASGVRKVGKSLLVDPAWSGTAAEPVTGRATDACSALLQLLKDAAIRHDGSPLLTEQVTATTVAVGPSGLRITSNGRVDAIKAAVWAVQAARDTGGEWFAW
jgi:hypothetical protein